MKMKGSFYKKYTDTLNNKTQSFNNERKHLIENYKVSEQIVNEVFDNFYKIEEVTKTKSYKDKEYWPDYSYEKEMLYSFEEFKTELVYDGFYDLSKLIKLSHFYLLFQEGYVPCF
jgi:hypothetical protein